MRGLSRLHLELVPDRRVLLLAVFLFGCSEDTSGLTSGNRSAGGSGGAAGSAGIGGNAPSGGMSAVGGSSSGSGGVGLGGSAGANTAGGGAGGVITGGAAGMSGGAGMGGTAGGGGTGGSCSGTCGDGVCSAGCETLVNCAADCGALIFSDADARRDASTGEWAFGSFKAECGKSQGVVGLSVSLSSRRAHAVLCTADGSVLTHGAASGCHALDLSAGSVGNSSDWDAGYTEAQCAKSEFVAGVAQTADGAINHILCCPGAVTQQGCATVSMFDGDNREAGAMAATGDWDSSQLKGECSPGRYVAGVSVAASAADPVIAGAGHAIYCCSP